MSEKELDNLQSELIRIEANLTALVVWLGVQLDSLKTAEKDIRVLVQRVTDMKATLLVSKEDNQQ